MGTLRALESGGPFLLVVDFGATRAPVAAPAPYVAQAIAPDPGYRGRFGYEGPPPGLLVTARDARDEARIRGLYDAAARATDDAAQALLDAVTRDGLADHTVIVVTADHGETLFEAGRGLGHGAHLFGDEGTHVPLVVVDPRHPGPHVVPSVVRDVDLAPTLYALTGVEPPADLDGRSLAPALEGEALAARPAFAETAPWRHAHEPGLPDALRLPCPTGPALVELDPVHDEVVLRRDAEPLTLVARHRMVREERWKLVYAPSRAEGIGWLFDTVEDPGELRDVAIEHPQEVTRLRARLEAWMARDPALAGLRGALGR